MSPPHFTSVSSRHAGAPTPRARPPRGAAGARARPAESRAPAGRGEGALVALGPPRAGQTLLPHDEHEDGQDRVQPDHCDNGGVKATVIWGHEQETLEKE